MDVARRWRECAGVRDRSDSPDCVWTWSAGAGGMPCGGACHVPCAWVLGRRIERGGCPRASTCVQAAGASVLGGMITDAGTIAQATARDKGSGFGGSRRGGRTWTGRRTGTLRRNGTTLGKRLTLVAREPSQASETMLGGASWLGYLLRGAGLSGSTRLKRMRCCHPIWGEQ